MTNRDKYIQNPVVEKEAQIDSAIRRDDTILRLGGDAFISAMTWTADDRQLVAIIDGTGWPATREQFYSSRLFAVSGSPQTTVIQEIANYPDVPLWDFFIEHGAPYYAFNALAVGGSIYQFLSTESGDYDHADRVTHTKLIYSPDNGRTWRNQDCSTPVICESRDKHSHENMAFFQAPQCAFSYPTFLQMGKDYQGNRDGFVYVYAPNGSHGRSMNELVMFRVPKDKILDCGAYEYFAGLKADGSAGWTPDINGRAAVHTFPSHPIPTRWPLSWMPSVAYNAPLGVYMMAASSGINGGTCVALEPTYLGLWVATNPWGPWRQIHEEAAWTPASDSGARAAGPQIAPKWIAQDGRSFWLVWTDVQQTTVEDILGPINQMMSSRPNYDEWMRARRRWREYHPFFGFNTQRFDLVVK